MTKCSHGRILERCDPCAREAGVGRTSTPSSSGGVALPIHDLDSVPECKPSETRSR